MAVTVNANYETAIDLYLTKNDWLSDEHTPLVTQLYKLASVLDSATIPRGIVGLSTEFRQTFNSLHALRPNEEESKQKDDDEEFLKLMGL